MFRRISFLNSRGFLQKKDKFSRGFLFSPLLLIPLFLVIVSGFLIKSIQGDYLVSNYSSHIITGLLGYFLAFFKKVFDTILFMYFNIFIPNLFFWDLSIWSSKMAKLGNFFLSAFRSS